jgi:hypothetical protein
VFYIPKFGTFDMLHASIGGKLRAEVVPPLQR